MEPQNTQNTPKDAGEDGVHPLTGPVVDCALTVLHGPGTEFLENVGIKRIVLAL